MRTPPTYNSLPKPLNKLSLSVQHPLPPQKYSRSLLGESYVIFPSSATPARVLISKANICFTIFLTSAIPARLPISKANICLAIFLTSATQARVLISKANACLDTFPTAANTSTSTYF